VEISVLTPVRDRGDHLANLVDGLNRADALEFELLVGWMGGADPRPALDRGRGFAAGAIAIEGDELPLARARNELAAAARGDVLVFLDVDCVPSRSLLAIYAATLADHDALAIGEVRYLSQGFRGEGATEDAMRRAASPRRERVDLFLAGGKVRLDDRHELFWSLNFAVRRATFEQRIGGFDPAYRGYGIEDTDFAMRAARAAVPLAFHQHHPAEARQDRDLDRHIDEQQVGSPGVDPAGDRRHPRRQPGRSERREVELGRGPAGIGSAVGVERQLDRLPRAQPPRRQRAEVGDHGAALPQRRADSSAADGVAAAVMVRVDTDPRGPAHAGGRPTRAR
jgi:Glycosyl transferase family 2